MRTCTLLLAAIVIYAVASATTADETSICPWRTVAHVDEPSIQFLGRWAVEQLHSSLDFDVVETAKVQAVGDCIDDINRNYELIIYAFDPSRVEPIKYKAVVSVTINSSEPQKLISFVNM